MMPRMNVFLNCHKNSLRAGSLGKRRKNRYFISFLKTTSLSLCGYLSVGQLNNWKWPACFARTVCLRIGLSEQEIGNNAINSYNLNKTFPVYQIFYLLIFWYYSCKQMLMKTKKYVNALEGYRFKPCVALANAKQTQEL